MSVAPVVHFAPLQLDVDYLANGLKQLHAVVQPASVFLAILPEVAVVLPFHTFYDLNNCRFTSVGNCVPSQLLVTVQIKYERD